MNRQTFDLFDANAVYARAHHADLLAEAERDRRLGRAAVAGEPGHGFGGRLVAALERAAAAALRRWPDSRDGLRSPEHELAARGFTWATDHAHERELALELHASRRRARRATAPVALPPRAYPPRVVPAGDDRAAA